MFFVLIKSDHLENACCYSYLAELLFYEYYVSSSFTSMALFIYIPFVISQEEFFFLLAESV